jgi:hypothetical protein
MNREMGFCIHCDEKTPMSVLERSIDGEIVFYQAECQDCLAQGPIVGAKEYAISWFEVAHYKNRSDKLSGVRRLHDQDPD